MKDALLLLCVLAAFALGFVPMKRLDRYLERNRAAADRAREEREISPEAARSEGVRHARSFRRGLALPGGWRGGHLFPLRHRS